MISLRALAVGILGALTAYAHPLDPHDLFIRAGGLMPSADPFYAAPQNISDYAAGAIIRSRRPPGPLALFAGRINIEGAWQVLYRTNGVFGEPLASVTTIIVPHNADYNKFLSYQVEIDSPCDECFPSITLQQSMADLASVTSQYGMLWVMSALEKGWVVSVPDHDGPNAAFGAGIITGQVTLDSVRAALQSKSITGLQPGAKVALWGYSGGSLATEWAVELQEKYAPELKITAVAVGGLPVDAPRAIVDVMNGGIGAGFAFSGAIGLSHAYPEFAALLKEKLLPNSSAINDVTKQCTIPTIVEFAYKSLWDYVDGGKDLLNNPVVQKVFAENVMGKNGVPKMPIYMYHAINDELLPFKDVQTLYDNYCSAGANIQFVKEAFGEHIIVALSGAAGALRFLMDRMDGKKAPAGCSSKQVLSSALNPANIPVLGSGVFNIVLSILGTPLGPQAWLNAAGQ